MHYVRSVLKPFSLFLLMSTFVYQAYADRLIDNNPVYRSKLNLDFSLLFASQSALPGFNFGGDYVFNGDQYVEAGKYLAIGGRFDAYFHSTGSILDISPYGKFQYAFNVPKGYLGIRLVIPIGVSIGIASNKAIAGWNIGILPGVDYFFDEHWGIFTEFGFSFHGFSSFSGSGATGAWNIGASYAF